MAEPETNRNKFHIFIPRKSQTQSVKWVFVQTNSEMSLITKIGVSLSLLSVTAWVTDQLSHNMLSHAIGKWLCGDHYMQQINGVISQHSCGFNTDLHLTALLILALAVGIILSLTTTVFFRTNSYY